MRRGLRVHDLPSACEGGREGISEAEDKELDRMETAAGIELNSRLGCQAVIEKPGTYVVEIPKWNRNYVQEGKPAHGPGS